MVVLAVALAVIAALLVIATRAGPDQPTSAASISVTTTTVTVTATAPGTTTPRTTTPRTTTPGPTTPGPSESTDPTSGLPWVAESSLPPEAGRTLALIRSGGPFPYPRNDDKTFRNDEDVLPKQRNGYYREYTVPTLGSSDRGARRIVTGAADEKYWTDDHYASFSRIREGA